MERVATFLQWTMEDIEKDDHVIEYVGQIEYKRRENNQLMKINGMNLWINRNKMVDLHNT
jgi:hypothetical protein